VAPGKVRKIVDTTTIDQLAHTVSELEKGLEGPVIGKPNCATIISGSENFA
jgi:hypothetical protein